jgi:hypothetical protein
MVTLALRERVPEGRVREPPRSDACAHGNSLSPTLSRLRDVALQREGSGGEGGGGLHSDGLNRDGTFSSMKRRRRRGWLLRRKRELADCSLEGVPNRS